MVEGITCPFCGSIDVARVLYGTPVFSEELQRKVDSGGVILAGCNAPEFGAFPFECRACGSQFDEIMAAHPSLRAFLSDEDYEWVEQISNMSDQDEDSQSPLIEDALAATLAQLAVTLLADDPEGFVHILESAEGKTYHNIGSPTFTRLMLIGLDYGVACGDGVCANYLGDLYFTGNVVEQDYDRAREFYELAEAQGVERAMLALGDVYDYGIHEDDKVLAFMQYSKAAVLTGSAEALFKMGDMYSRGTLGERDLLSAYRLYEKSLEAADDVVEKGKAAFRVANVISNQDVSAEWGTPFDPMRALELFQLAERALRVGGDNSQPLHAHRLRQVIEGQERMRRLLDR